VYTSSILVVASNHFNDLPSHLNAICYHLTASPDAVPRRRPGQRRSRSSGAGGLPDQAKSHSATEIASHAKPTSQPNMATAMIARKAEPEARRFHPRREAAAAACSTVLMMPTPCPCLCAWVVGIHLQVQTRKRVRIRHRQPPFSIAAWCFSRLYARFILRLVPSLSPGRQVCERLMSPERLIREKSAPN